jgi:hypothetical protein
MNCEAIVSVIPTTKCGEEAKYRIVHDKPRRTLFACGAAGHLEQLVESALEFDPVPRVARANLSMVPELAPPVVPEPPQQPG